MEAGTRRMNQKEKTNYAWLHGHRKERQIGPTKVQTAAKIADTIGCPQRVAVAIEDASMVAMIRIREGRDRMDAAPKIDLESMQMSQEDVMNFVIDLKRGAVKRGEALSSGNITEIMKEVGMEHLHADHIEIILSLI